MRNQHLIEQIHFLQLHTLPPFHNIQKLINLHVVHPLPLRKLHARISGTPIYAQTEKSHLLPFPLIFRFSFEIPRFPTLSIPQPSTSTSHRHKRRDHLLPPERAPFRQPRFPSRRLTQYGRASSADDDGLGVRENGGDGEAAGALDVHEEGTRGGHEGLLL